ncbi:hypothetical protein PVAP13_5NG632013 [Panicum virgatum]|uniref:Uncharacterized protein n=1 Tax=Panicum virgatum TaxID=38727 RepID=A0A8T0S778_PANVG|nr:hypothetical protein PVAP13_5NG632013 [Panicum virgatum]
MASSSPPPAQNVRLRFDCYREIARGFPTIVNTTSHRRRQPRRRPHGCSQHALMRENALALTAPKHHHQRCCRVDTLHAAKGSAVDGSMELWVIAYLCFLKCPFEWV